MHNQLYFYSYVNHKGKFKTMDNTIVGRDSLGNKKVRFQSVSSFETESYFDEMVAAYRDAVKENIPQYQQCRSDYLVPSHILEIKVSYFMECIEKILK